MRLAARRCSRCWSLRGAPRQPQDHAARHRGRGDVRRVRDRAERLHLPGRRPGARASSAAGSRGQGQAGDQGRARRRVRPQGARDAPRARGFDAGGLARARRAALLALLAGWRRLARALARDAGARRRARAGDADLDRGRRAPPRRRARGLRPRERGVDTTVVAAFAVGFVSFISPCVLPLVPGYLSAVSGVSLTETPARRAALRRVLLPAIVFCLAFTVVFVALGMTATGLGSTLRDARGTLDKVAGRRDHRARRALRAHAVRRRG